MRQYFDKLLCWEKPLYRERYVVAVDVADGIGKDRSVVTVLRVGTVENPDEEVAQYVTDSVDPIGLAPIVDAIGRLYRDTDGLPATCAVETNNHGLSTQNELQERYGYNNLWIWRRWDAISPRNRLSRAYGWATTGKTRPLIITRLFRGITTIDERTGLPDLVVNSPITLHEMRSFVPDPQGGLAWARAAGAGHDDALLALAIATHVATTLYLDDTEPIHERRRRKAEELARKTEIEERLRVRVDYQNTACSAEEVRGGEPLPQVTDPYDGEEELTW